MFYLNCKEVSGVILCDNSMSVDSDFFQEKEKAKKIGKPLEIMYIHTDESKISQYGKGYGEAEILDHVVNHSCLLKQDDRFLKVTGRLMLTNADTLIKKQSLTLILSSINVVKLLLIHVFSSPKWACINSFSVKRSIL